MKNITIKNWKGDTYSGLWNGKTYSSKVEGHDELIRIYVDNEPIHVTQEAISDLGANIEKDRKIRTHEKINLFVDNLSTSEKCYAARQILTDIHIINNLVIDGIDSDAIFKSLKALEEVATKDKD